MTTKARHSKHIADQYRIIEIQFDQAEQPKFVEKKGKGYIEFGKDNNYPKYLLGLYNESAKHGAIVKGKCNYIFGGGFNDNGNANHSGETYNDLLKKCIKDDEIYRGYYLQIIWNRAKKVSDIYHIDFAKVRVSKDLSKFYVKNNWEDNKEEMRRYEAFNPANPIGSQILYIKEYNPVSEYYPLPSYFQGLNYIESDIEVSRHILGNAKKGFVASTLINLNNGDPINEEHKAEVERGLLKKFGGHDSMRTVIMFNKSKDNAAEIVSLGNSMLTKEDFTNVNNLIQQEIFACHQITSPVLFGIKTEGQLGARNEIRDAYEIFSNTYVNERQYEFEKVFTKITRFVGQEVIMKIKPVEPLKFEFTESIMSANLTQDEIRDIMGKEPLEVSTTPKAANIADNLNSLSPLVATKVLESMSPDEIRQLAGLPPQNAVATTNPSVNALPNSVSDISTPMSSNDSLKNLTGRQYQNVMRIVRQFTQNKINKAQATLLLKSGYGLNDQEVNMFLGIEDNESQMFSDEEKNRVLQAFADCGTDIDKYEVIHSESIKEDFADDKINQIEASVLEILKKNKNEVPQSIAEALKVDVKVVNRVLKSLAEEGIISIKTKSVGEDTIEQIKIEKPLSELKISKPIKNVYFIAYTYEWRDIVKTKDRIPSTSRPFCQTLMGMSASKDKPKGKTWSMQDIQSISIRMGYSVLDRAGGWWYHNGKADEQCRHEWVANVVVEKK
jgi:DNA-binding transcriptional regulator YhcF (GntR family)